MGTSELQEVPSNVLKKFMSSMRDDLPNSVHAYGFLCTLLDWREKQTELEISILAPNGDPRLGILFYFILNDAFLGSVYAHNDTAVEALQEAVLSTNKVPYLLKHFTLFTNLNNLGVETVERLTLTPEWQLGNNIAAKDYTFWLPWEKAKEIEVHIPDGVEIRELTKDHAKHVNDHWPYSFQGSEELIKIMIDLNFGLGVFRGETLLSWALMFYYGGIGTVKTLEEERGKGYGKAVVTAMTKRMGQMEKDVHLMVIDGNEQAENFFKSLGFTFAFTSWWYVRWC